MDADMQLDSSLIKLAESYASCDRRSAEINDERKTIRDNAEKLGIPSKSFQHAVGMVKHMSDGERRDYQTGVNRVLRAISDRQNDLFPVEAERNRKREAAKGVDGKAGAPDPDSNPRSDPKSGGAGKKAPKDVPLKETIAQGDATIKDVAAKRQAQAAAEQEEGAKALERIRSGGETPPEPPAETGAPKSQSEIAAEKRAQALLN